MSTEETTILEMEAMPDAASEMIGKIWPGFNPARQQGKVVKPASPKPDFEKDFNGLWVDESLY